MQIMNWLAVLPAMVLATVAATTMAAEPRGPCAEEIKKFCADVKPGGGAIEECLKGHDAELSPACKTHQETVRKKFDEFNAACGEDVKKHCPDTTAGQGRIIACLRDHESDVSGACMALIGKKKPVKGHGQGPSTR